MSNPIEDMMNNANDKGSVIDTLKNADKGITITFKGDGWDVKFFSITNIEISHALSLAHASHMRYILGDGNDLEDENE